MPQDDKQSITSSHESAWSDAEDEQYEFFALHDGKCFDSMDLMLQHEVSEHQFDLQNIRKSLNMDLYDSIKLVNHVRSTKATESEVRAAWSSIRSNDALLKPVLENDALLFHLVEDEDAVDGGSRDPESEWKSRFEALQAQYTLLQQTMAKSIEERATDKSEEKPDNDTYYFDSYGYNDIHETMLKDAVRTDAYRDAVYDNKDVFKDKIILDVGCGTGILSMFCVKAGAKHVYAIDNSNIIDKARSNAYENGMDDNITFIKGKVESIQLPVPKVDIIISEWMGYALLYESMLDSVLSARNRFLAADGLMVPSLTTMVIAGLSDKDYFDDRVNFWSDIYGFKMGAMKDGIFDDILIDSLQAKSLGTEPVVFESLDLHKVEVEDLIFKQPFELSCLPGHDSIIAFHIWFDTFFTRARADSAEIQTPIKGAVKTKTGNAFSTGPHGTPTHWKQAVLLIDGEVSLAKDEILYGEVEYRKGQNNHRYLEIVVTWRVAKQGCTLDGAEERSQIWHLA